MKWIFAAVLSIFALPLFAQVSPTEVESMINQMVKENVIDAQEAEKAKIKMRSMTARQWEQINQQAKEVAYRSPASVEPSSNNITEVHKLDLDGEQFKQIQRDIERIVPPSH